MKHRYLPVMILIALLTALTGCNAPVTPENGGQSPQTSSSESLPTEAVTTTKPEITTTTAAVTETAEVTEVQPETETLGLYEQILTKLEAHENVIRFSKPISQEALNPVVNQVIHDHPELFWLKEWTCTITPSWSKVEFYTEISDGELPGMCQKLDAALKEITDRVPADMDAYGKALFVHDYLIAHTDYAQDAVKDGEALYGISAYDCLVGHRAVCSGYSRAYQLVMQRLGFDCGVCSGMSRGQTHAWNYVQIDGKYYWVDVTFDDPISADGGGADSDNMEHSYFLIDDEMLRRTRTFDTENLFIPVCDSVEQNYYVRNGQFLETYSPESVDAVLARQAEQHRAEIMFRTSEAYHEAISELLDQEKIWDLETIRSSGSMDLQYQTEDNMNVLILFF